MRWSPSDKLLPLRSLLDIILGGRKVPVERPRRRLGDGQQAEGGG